MKYSAEELKNATEMLKQYAPKGSTVFCVIRNVSRSGMSRRIDFFTIVRGDKHRSDHMQYLSGWMAVLMGYARSDKGLRVNGCGMDMGFHMVEGLGAALYGRDPKTGIGAGLRHEWI